MVIIIGAGLSGLLLGYRLTKKGINFKILEARPRVGGRINTLFGANQTPIEMGATWFGNQHKFLKALLQELDIEYFEQYMEGGLLFQEHAFAPPEIINVHDQTPSYRISGGSSILIDTLYNKIDQKNILLNQTVSGIKVQKNVVQVIANETFEANQVVLSLPPKLWAKNILFEPQLPVNLIDTAKQTQTWMEESIKVALTYKHPFWINQNLSGAFFSNIGPITEFYDHCNQQRSKYALCGFVNPAKSELSKQERKTQILNQLKSIFGAEAQSYLNYQECIWSEEENTYSKSDVELFPHQNNGNPIFRESYFKGKLLISSSESAIEFPGYMDGAVNAANATFKKLINSK